MHVLGYHNRPLHVAGILFANSHNVPILLAPPVLVQQRRTSFSEARKLAAGGT
jgi:hypothetical protein